MLQLTGTPRTDISNIILGKISHKSVGGAKRKNYILVTDDDPGKGYAAVLSSEPLFHPKAPAVLCNKEELLRLHDGDIVSIDGRGRIDILYERLSAHNSLLVTERCNCSCVMCPQHINNHETDKTPLNLRIISLIDKNVRSLGITGGEPTLLGDGLIDIVRTCRDNLPKTTLILLTNGIRLDDFDYVKKLMLIQHPDLIIDIPVYSDTDTEHNKIIRANGFYRTIAGLYNLARFNQRIGLRIVIHKLTYQRLPQLAEFIYHNFPFIFHVAFMQMETINLARENIEHLWIDPHDYNEQLQKATLYLWRRGMNVSIYNSQLCVLPRDLWPFARKSISDWKNIYLDRCAGCNVRQICGGLFESSKDLYSNYLRPLKETI